MYKTQLHVLISVALLGITIAMDQLLYQVLKSFRSVERLRRT